MPEIKPFKGLIYNLTLPIHKLVAPPYDVISDEERDSLYMLHPYNVIRLILNKDENRYESAKGYFEKWLNDGIIVEREKEAIFVYEQEFEYEEKGYTRSGIICLMRLEELGKGNVFPHEKTLPKPKEDRFNLLKATNAQFDHIFGIYSDPNFVVENIIKVHKPKQPLFDFEFPAGSKIKHKLYEITDENFIHSIIDFFKTIPIFIADGHHRYETGLMFRDYMRSLSLERDEHNYILMYLTNMESEGLMILPTHRVLTGVDKENLKKKLFSEDFGKFFDIAEIDTLDELKSFMRKFTRGVFGVHQIDGKSIVLKIKDYNVIEQSLAPELPQAVKKLDVTILHEFIFRLFQFDLERVKIIYTHDFKTAVELSKQSDKISFILNPPSVSDVKNVSLSGVTMPQKSTYFYPKLLSGIVMRKF
ncbi:DUF1015 domain-containing protein [Candidatus Kryptobacter tengchongensis]|uniref:DUF1015 domain-containing protein n=1 Tax=Kryptobacter tengchongensis TaxID=1643429 RepID=UPI000707C211|nr:DUF1015 domain-containing protein [Candidatus Kryptobacter tengchongensis]CUS89077.1 Uncharacterized conserved protein, DUF1015 family [Candidatus Kryptobacter tengchongensis]